MAAPFIVHQSTIKSYRHCRQQYHYRYMEKIERRRRPNPLIRGTIIHKMVELGSTGKDPFLALKAAAKQYDKLFREEKEEYGDLIGDIGRLMTGYFDWYAIDPVKPILLKGIPAVELNFSVELCKGVQLEGKIDRVGTTRDKLRWLEDTKSHKTLPEGDINYSDIQTVLYTWAFEKQWDVKIDGILWNYIRYKAPTIPELLKSGELSHANIDTLWPVYADAIKRHKLDPKDYQDMKKKLEGKESSFFIRARLPVNKKLHEAIRAEAIITAKEMQEERDPYRNIGRHCSWCEYAPLCQAELRGLDASIIRKKSYQAKQEHDEIEVE